MPPAARPPVRRSVRRPLQPPVLPTECATLDAPRPLRAVRASAAHAFRTAATRTLSGVTLAALALFSAACSTDAPAADDRVRADSPLTIGKRTPVYRVDVVRSFAHDTAAFTQGLLWHNGEMYESTGGVGTSNIRRIELQTGDVKQRRDLPAPHFGEGIVILGEKLYQLTWQSGKAFVYDKNTFAPIGEFTYEGEGWGLTTDGTHLIMSDGKSRLRFLDPETFKVVREVPVNENGSSVDAVNELEMVKGEIWANKWMTDRIMRIDPKTGTVLGWIDLAGLLPQNQRTGGEDVLNGIAYDAEGDRIFVTGKKWPRLYQITLRAAN